MAASKRKERQNQPKLNHTKTLDASQDEDTVSKKRSRVPKSHQEESNMISKKMSEKIMKKVFDQQKQIDYEERKAAAFDDLSLNNFEQVDDGDGDAEDGGSGFDDLEETQSLYDAGVEIDEDDEKLLEAFMSKNDGPQLNLADIIIQKIKEKDAEVTSVAETKPIPLDVKELYKGVGTILRRYTNGKIPKAFKHIPYLQRWEEYLLLTEPENWSANAMYQATRIFSSNLDVKKAQRFYKCVLLPRIRDDIRKNKRLHFALYQSLKKSLYKSAAFMKEILFPLCQSGTCSLREAVIVGSIIQKLSIDSCHSSAALLKLVEMDYCGTTSYFIKLFLDKKYNLPQRVIDALVAHFMRFCKEERIMPVIWHQSLLAFVQRYKNGLTKEDKVNLDRLVQHQKHHLVTPEIRRELKNSTNRGENEDGMMSTAPSICVINKKIKEDRWDVPEVPMEED